MAITASEKVIVSAAIEADDRAELERMAAEGDRTLSQEIRRGLRAYLAREHADPKVKA